MKIAVVGLWHLGEIYSVCLAELGHTVVGISDDASVIADLEKGIPPLAEPRLSDLLKRNQAERRLRYTTDDKVISDCDAVWITFDTPVDNKDRVDTSVIFDCLARLVPHLKNGILLGVSSQLPVGTSRTITAFIKKERPKLTFRYTYVPENLRLGEAVGSFLSPKRIVVGAEDTRTYETVRAIFRNTGADFLYMSPASAEMVKHALNAFLATSLSFTYDIADVCETVGADILDVSRALKSDPRIGEKAYLDASVGFSGGTLGRDLRVLLHEANASRIDLPVIRSVFRKNKERKKTVLHFLKTRLKNLKNKKIIVAGLTYKAGTSTLRRSLPLEIAEEIWREGAHIGLYDATVGEKDIKEAVRFPFSCEKMFLASLKGAHACVIITPWDGLKKTDFKKMRAVMKNPAILFDARNFLASEAERIKKAGICYRGVGRK